MVLKSHVRLRRLLLLLCAALAAILTSCVAPRQTADVSFFFDRAPHVNPRIISDLTSSVADVGDQVVSIDLPHSQDSNRYFGGYKIRAVSGGAPWVSFVDDHEDFGYRFVGTSPAGVHVVKTYSGGGRSGGTMSWVSLVFVEFVDDFVLSVDDELGALVGTRRRTLIRKVGQMSLGDRWYGDVRLDGNWLYVGQDQREILLDPVNGPTASWNQPREWHLR